MLLDGNAREDPLTGQLVQHFEPSFARARPKAGAQRGPKGNPKGAAGEVGRESQAAPDAEPSFRARCHKRLQVLCECAGYSSSQSRFVFALPYGLLILGRILGDALRDEYRYRKALALIFWTGAKEKVFQ